MARLVLLHFLSVCGTNFSLCCNGSHRSNANIAYNLLRFVNSTGPSSHVIIVLIRACLLSPHQTLQTYYTEHVRRLNVTFPVLYITFSLFAVHSVALVDQLQSTCGLGNAKWRIMPINPILLLLHDRQIDATFTDIANVRQGSGPVASRPIPGTPTTAAPVCQPPLSPDFSSGRPLG
jgi:hypothetical protein